MLTGYAHPSYAFSLSEFGNPRELPRCGGWILERQIHGFPFKDGMGCYPLFCCRDWSKLHLDLDDLNNDLISLTLVTDPFGNYDISYLQKHFDLVKPFKKHFIANLNLPIEKIVSKHHRYYAKKALQSLQIELCLSPEDFLDEWIILYNNLIEKHNINGIRAFSRQSFSEQLVVPGIVIFRALYKGETIGARLVYIQDQVAYSHLSAFNPNGYNLRAGYGIDMELIRYLSINGLRYFDHGAGAGIINNTQDGLSKFKKGWSTETRTAYLCGRIFDKKKYLEITTSKNIVNTKYFPAYREGEFV